MCQREKLLDAYNDMQHRIAELLAPLGETNAERDGRLNFEASAEDGARETLPLFRRLLLDGDIAI